MDKKRLEEEINTLKELGFDIEFDDDTTDEEKLEILGTLPF